MEPLFKTETEYTFEKYAVSLKVADEAECQKGMGIQ